MQIKSISLSSSDQTMKRGSGKRFPVKLKDLLATGILERLKVRYVKGQKARKPGEKDLQGVIKDSGILCFCGSCKGNQVVSPNVFELHAGSANKRPPEYTYLENGKPLRDVMNACSSLPLDTLDKVVQMVLGDFTMQNSNICFNCRGSISESNKGKSKLVCNPCMELKETQTNQLQTAATCSKSITTVVQPSQKMEEDDKNKASGKMISSTTDHHQKEGDDVAMNDSTFSLQLASSLNRTPKKRKEGPEAKTTSAGTSSKKRRGRALGFGSKNKREEGPSEKTTSAETSSKNIRVSPISPAQTLGSSVHGTIDGKFDDGYIVTVDLGSEQLKGVLYHVSSNASKGSSIGGLSGEKVER